MKSKSTRREGRQVGRKEGLSNSFLHLLLPTSAVVAFHSLDTFHSQTFRLHIISGVGKMSFGDFEGEWRAASYFLAKGPSATLQFLAEGARAHLFALKTQALDGNCPPGQDGSLATDPSLRERQEAWKALYGMSKEEAKKGLVELLTEVLPEWKDWCKEHAPSNLNGEEHESEADRLLKAFRKKLASRTSVFSSRL